MIGIIGAMKVEIEAIEDLMTNKEEIKIGTLSFTKGLINNKDVVVAVCGIGKVFAGICAQTMCLNFKLDYLLNVGVAGSLSKNLGIANIAISKDLVQHDMDTSPLGDPKGLISGINIIKIPANKALIEKIEKASKESDLKYEVGTIASGDQFIVDGEKKMEIIKNFSPIACEMEGAAIAQVAYVNNVPFCVIRAISDNTDGSSPISYMEFTKIAVQNSKKLISKLI